MLNLKKLLAKMLSTDSITISNTAGADARACRNNRVVTLTVINPNKLNSGSNNIGTLPVGWRPANTMYFLAGTPSFTPTYRYAIYNNGTIELYNYGSAVSASTNATTSMTFIASA